MISYDRRSLETRRNVCVRSEGAETDAHSTLRRPFLDCARPPYTNKTLAQLHDESKRHGDFHEQVIGKTAGGLEPGAVDHHYGPSKNKRRSG